MRCYIFITTLLLLQTSALAQDIIVEWFNINATKTVCNSTELSTSANQVSSGSNCLLNRTGYPVITDWNQEPLTARVRGLRERALSCSALCNWKCYNQPYLCYGICSGCGRRLGDGDVEVDEERELSNLSVDLKTSCENTLKTGLPSTLFSTQCWTALKASSCRVKVSRRSLLLN